jgi:iron complex outermembrane receptor protein
MKNKRSKNPTTSRDAHTYLAVPTRVAAAVCFALYGLPRPASADSVDPTTEALQEVTVTANRRVQTLEAVPYSRSVISGDQISASGATDIATLATQVPGLSMYDYGARFAGATAPIIRGINATGSPARGFRTFEQDPVGTYIATPKSDPFRGGIP